MPVFVVLGFALLWLCVLSQCPCVCPVILCHAFLLTFAADAGQNCKNAIMNLLILVFWEF